MDIFYYSCLRLVLRDSQILTLHCGKKIFKVTKNFLAIWVAQNFLCNCKINKPYKITNRGLYDTRVTDKSLASIQFFAVCTKSVLQIYVFFLQFTDIRQMLSRRPFLNENGREYNYRIVKSLKALHSHTVIRFKRLNTSVTCCDADCKINCT